MLIRELAIDIKCFETILSTQALSCTKVRIKFQSHDLSLNVSLHNYHNYQYHSGAQQAA